MPVHLRRQREVAVHGTGVRIEEQLRRVPAGAGPRVPAAVHPVAVPLPGPHAGHEAVPDLVGQLGEGHPDLGARAVRASGRRRSRRGTARRPRRRPPTARSWCPRHRPGRPGTGRPAGSAHRATRARPARRADCRSARRRAARAARRPGRAPPALPPARLRWTPHASRGSMERRAGMPMASRPRLPVASSSPLFCPALGSHSRFPRRGLRGLVRMRPAPLPRGRFLVGHHVRHAQTRAARAGAALAAVLTWAGLLAGAAGCTSATAWTTGARQAPFARGRHPGLAGRRQQGRTPRGEPAGAGARPGAWSR